MNRTTVASAVPSTARQQKIDIGSRIITGAGIGKKGVVRFIGETEFSAGEWIGVALDTPDGKNDGSVADVRYFDCLPNHGLFVKRAQVRFDRDEITNESKDKITALREKRKARDATTAKGGALDEAESDNILQVPVDNNNLPAPPIAGNVTTTIRTDTQDDGSLSMNTASIPDKLATSDSPQKPVSLTPLLPESSATISTPLLGATLTPPSINSSQKVDFYQSENEILRNKLKETESALTAAISALKDAEAEKEKLKEKEIAASASSSTAAAAAAAFGSPAAAVKDKTMLAAQTRRVTELENQISDLNQSMELLSLDKEQLAMDLEAAEDTARELQSEIDQLRLRMSLQGGVSVSASASQQHPTSSSSSGQKGTSSTSDSEPQLERLREALLKLHQTSSAEILALKTRLRELEGTEARAAEKAKEVEALLTWQTQAKERIEALSQSVDESSGYEELLEKLTESNLDLKQRVSQLTDTVTDLEASQEIMEELDANQRAELDSLRKQQDSTLLMYKNAKEEIRQQDLKIEELKRNGERFRSTIEELKSENQMLQSQLAKDRLELHDAYDKNKDALGQRRYLLHQAERTRHLTMLLRRSEMGQRLAESKAARLQALIPPLQIANELRVYYAEAGLIKLLNRVVMTMEAFRGELGDACRDRGDGEGEWRSSELTGDKVIRMTDLTAWTIALARLVGLIWISVVAVETRESGSSSGSSGDLDGSSSSSLCAVFLQVEAVLDPVLTRREQGDWYISAGSTLEQFMQSLESCCHSLQPLPCFASLGGTPLKLMITLEEATVEKVKAKETEESAPSSPTFQTDEQSSSLLLKFHETRASVNGLAAESHVMGLLAQLSLLLAVDSVRSSDEGEVLQSQSSCRGKLDQLLSTLRGIQRGTRGADAVLQSLGGVGLDLGGESTLSLEHTSLESIRKMELPSKSLYVSTLFSHLSKPSMDVVNVLKAERAELNGSSISISSTLFESYLELTSAIETCLQEYEALASTPTGSGNAPLPALLSAPRVAWGLLVDGRIDSSQLSHSTAGLSTSSSASSTSSSCEWRRRCLLVRSHLEQQLVEGDGAALLKESLRQLKAELEASKEELRCSIRRGQELGALIDKQSSALLAAEEVARKEQQRARREVELQKEVKTLTEALDVIQGKLEGTQGELKRATSFAGGGGGMTGTGASAATASNTSGGNSSYGTSENIWEAGVGYGYGGDGASSVSVSLALRGALLVGAAWKSLLLKRLSATLKPIPTASATAYGPTAAAASGRGRGAKKSAVSPGDSHMEGEEESKETPRERERGRGEGGAVVMEEPLKSAQILRMYSDVRLARAGIRIVKLGGGRSTTSNGNDNGSKSSGGVEAGIPFGHVSAALSAQDTATARKVNALTRKLGMLYSHGRRESPLKSTMINYQ